MSRCTGHCCESFPLQYSPDRIQEEGHKFQDGEISATRASSAVA